MISKRRFWRGHWLPTSCCTIGWPQRFPQGSVNLCKTREGLCLGCEVDVCPKESYGGSWLSGKDMNAQKSPSPFSFICNVVPTPWPFFPDPLPQHICSSGTVSTGQWLTHPRLNNVSQTLGWYHSYLGVREGACLKKADLWVSPLDVLNQWLLGGVTRCPLSPGDTGMISCPYRMSSDVQVIVILFFWK